MLLWKSLVVWFGFCFFLKKKGKKKNHTTLGVEKILEKHHFNMLRIRGRIPDMQMKANKQGHDFWSYGLWCWILMLSVMDPSIFWNEDSNCFSDASDCHSEIWVMRSNSVSAWDRIKISEKRGKTAVMEVLEGRATGFASAVGWIKVYSLMCLANTWEVFHRGSIHREWQICFIDHSSYFWLLKNRLWLTLLCRCSNRIWTLPAVSYHNLNYKEPMCLWIWKYPWCCMLIWILLFPEHLIFKKLDPILNLLVHVTTVCCWN